MRRAVLSAVLLIVLVIVTYALVSRFAPRVPPTNYNGIDLPFAKPPGNVAVYPPPAWLIVGDQAIPGTFSSYCYTSGNQSSCVDSSWPDENIQLATATLPTDTDILLVAAPTINSFGASAWRWGDYSSGRQVASTRQPDDQLAVFTLEPLGPGDHVLSVGVGFAGNGGASYFWRVKIAAR